MLKRLIIRSVFVMLITFSIGLKVTDSVYQAGFISLCASLIFRGSFCVFSVLPQFFGTIAKYGMLSVIFRSLWGIMLIFILLLIGSGVILTSATIIGFVLYVKDFVEAFRFDRGVSKDSNPLEVWEL